MAKSKKSESESSDKASKPAAKGAKASAEKAPAEKAPAKSAKKPAKGETKAEKKSAPSSTSASPQIDTNLAAQAAASMVRNRGASPTMGGTPAKESASFKAFKQGVNKPQLPGGILGNALPQKKGASNQPFAGGKQVGHNQTFGADVARTGVPRRTSG